MKPLKYHDTSPENPLTPALSLGGEREPVVAPPSMGGVGEGDVQAAK